MPERAKARSADCAPGPGVFVLLPPVALSLMCSAVMPSDLHFSATSCKTENHISWLEIFYVQQCRFYICKKIKILMFSFFFKEGAKQEHIQC